VNRISDFAIADLKAKGVSSTEVIDKLATALGRPVNCE
jgi:hypothetical protein